MNDIGVFLSYAHEDRDLAVRLKSLLEAEGFSVWIDEGELRAGDSLIHSIATAIHEMEFVVALITDASADSRWCTYEIHLAMTSGLNREGVKVLPLRVGSAPIPSSLEDTYCLPLDTADIGAGVAKLVAGIRSHHEDRVASAAAGEPLPTTGSDVGRITKPVRLVAAAPDPALEFSRPEPVRIIGIAKEGVGQPRNDGSPGSALYRVPLRLSRRPSALWSQLFVDCWNHPPSWTTMHRPGIASVLGDTIVLDGTTLDELEKVHVRTLKLCVEQTNAYEEERLMKQWDKDTQEARALREHQRQVDDAADRIRFDDGE